MSPFNQIDHEELLAHIENIYGIQLTAMTESMQYAEYLKDKYGKEK